MTAEQIGILNAYRETVMEIDAIERQIAKLPLPVYPAGLPTSSASGMPNGTNEKAAKALQEWDWLESNLRDQQEELRGIVAAFNSIVNDIADATDRTIIRMYYAVGMNDYQIAKEEGKSRSWVVKRRLGILKK